jgi:hypothetical protein
MHVAPLTRDQSRQPRGTRGGAYLTDQPLTACAPEAVDLTLAAAPYDRGQAAHVAYEAAP